MTMNKNIRKQYNNLRTLFPVLTLGLLLAVLTFSCTDEDYVPRTGASEREITLRLSTGSSGSGTQTYGMDADQEQKLKDIDFLIFTYNDGTGNFLYEETRHLTVVTGNEYSVRIHVRDDVEQVFMVMANAHSELQAAALSTTDELETAIRKVQVGLVSNKEWDQDYIPMFARHLLKTDTLYSLNLSLIRAMARIDVSVKDDVNFELINAVLFNRPLSGVVGYDAGATNWDETNRKALKPTLPTTPTKTLTPAVIFDVDAEGEITRQIYTFEAAGTSTRADATAIVVGGKYNGGSTTYYRIDIPAFESSGAVKEGTMGDILRNRLYDIEIKGVSGNGANTREAAFNNPSSLINVEIVPWNLQDLNVTSGQYWLNLNRDNFTVKNNGATSLQLDINTNYGEGWEAWLVDTPSVATPPDAFSWITFNPAADAADNPTFSGAANTKTSLVFNVEPNTGAAATPYRVAYLKIRAGNLEKHIKICQSDYEVDVDGSFEWQTDQILVENSWVNYHLGVDKSAFTLDRTAKTKLELNVIATYPNGFGVTSTDNSWLRVTNGGTTASGAKTLLFDVDLNASSSERTAYIVITSGNLTKQVKVTQAADRIDGTGVIPIENWVEINEEIENGAWLNYRLGVDKASVSLYKEAVSGNRIYVATTYSGGFSVTASSTGNWLTTTDPGLAASGGKYIQFDVALNATGASRTGTLIIKAGKLTKTVQVTQSNTSATGGDSQIVDWEEIEEQINDGSLVSYRLGVSKAAYTFFRSESKANQLYVETSYSGGFTATVESGTWLSVTSGDTRTSAGGQYVYFNVAENTTLSERSTYLVLKAGKLTKRVKVTQNSTTSGTQNGQVVDWEEVDEKLGDDSWLNYRLGVSKAAYSLTREESTSTLYVETTHASGFSVSLEGEGSWLSITAGSGGLSAKGGTNVSFKVIANTTASARTGYIVFKAGRITKKVQITQSTTASVSGGSLVMDWVDITEPIENGGWQSYRLGVDKTVFSLFRSASTGNKLYVETTYANGFTVTSDDTSWLRVTSNGSTTSSGGVTVQFEVDKNSGTTDRTANLVVVSGKLTKKVQVTQGKNIATGSDVVINDWEEVTEKVDDGSLVNYRLGVDRGSFSVTRIAGSYTINVETSYSGGFTVTKEDGNGATGWLAVSGGTSVKGVGTAVFTLTQNPTSASRTGYVVITAGKLSKKVAITQSINTESEPGGVLPDWGNGGVGDVTIGDDSHTLSLTRDSCAYDGDAKSSLEAFSVGATGVGSWSVTSSETWLTVNTPSGTANGTKTPVKITMTPNIGTTRTATLAVKIGKLTKNVKVVQYVGQGLTVSNLSSSYYYYYNFPALGIVQPACTFTLTGAAPWNAAVTTDMGKAIRILHTTEGKSVSSFRFSLNEMASGDLAKTAIITFTSPTGEFNAFTVEITAEPNNAEVSP